MRKTTYGEIEVRVTKIIGFTAVKQRACCGEKCCKKRTKREIFVRREESGEVKEQCNLHYVFVHIFTLSSSSSSARMQDEHSENSTNGNKDEMKN